MRCPALFSTLLVAALALGGCGAPEEAAPPPAAPTALGQGDLKSQAEKAETEALRQKPKKEKPKKRLKDPVYGADVSWPQCPRGMGIPERQGEGQPMPLAEAKYVIIGLTNGPGFTPNPCIADQLAWARQRHLMIGAYSVVSYPSPQTLQRYGTQGPFKGKGPGPALMNVGYQQALFNIRTMERVQLVTPLVWIDVEPYPVFPWSKDVKANEMVVRGALRGYQEGGFRVGFYSTPNLWKQVVGSLRFGLPEWRAAGLTGADEALRRCEADWSFQGGPAIVGQWTDGKRDHNVTCKGTARQLDRFFHAS